MDKRAIDIALMLWIVATIGVVALYAIVNERATDVGHIGDMEFASLEAELDRQFLDAYIDAAASHSMNYATEAVATRPELQGLSKEPCPLLNSEEDVFDLVTDIHVNEGATRAFNERMNDYLTSYTQATGLEIPLNNYELALSPGRVLGIAIKPVRIPLNVYGPVGEYVYRPSFSLTINHELERYDDIEDTLSAVIDECFTNPLDCITGSVWNLRLNGNVIEYRLTAKGHENCYGLVLPSIELPDLST